MGQHNIKELIIWKKAMALSIAVYQKSLLFPKEDMYGLVSQLRRSAISIPSNISEGFGRSSEKELQHFLSVANGSTNELFTQISISSSLNLISNEDAHELTEQINEVQKLIRAFRQKIELSLKNATSTYKTTIINRKTSEPDFTLPYEV